MRKRFQLSLIGDFALGCTKSGGQQAKTLSLSRALHKYYSYKEICKIDTWNWHKYKIQFIRRILYAVFVSKQLIILPAQNGVQIIAPLFILLGKPLHRQLYYVVIGGWLPEMTKQKKWLAYFLKRFNGIFVETNSMKNALEQQGFKNIFIMPNFKNLQILKEKELVYTTKAPFPFCMFSRVMKEKGIEDAIEAITAINKQYDKAIATLDIYGKIDENYKNRFEKLQKTFPSYIQYKGVASPNESVNIIKNYFALLFPTYYEGEGFAGTLIDAMSAGVPVIASDWRYNKEIVIEGKNGVIISSTSSLLNEIKKAIEEPGNFNLMKTLCLKESQKYTPQNAINILLEQLKDTEI